MSSDGGTTLPRDRPGRDDRIPIDSLQEVGTLGWGRKPLRGRPDTGARSLSGGPLETACDSGGTDCDQEGSFNERPLAGAACGLKWERRTVAFAPKRAFGGAPARKRSSGGKPGRLDWGQMLARMEAVPHVPISY